MHKAMVLVVAAMVLLGGCRGEERAAPPTDPSPAESPSGQGATRELTARVGEWDGEAGTVVLDEVAMLSGQEAVAAAREDGQLPEGEDSLPNDFYIDDLPDTPARAPVSAGATARLFDCAEGCRLRDVDVQELLDGRVRPLNGDGAVFRLRLSAGEVVWLEELYFP